ncbi:pyridoxamine 5'-phosphate oxidase family protein [Lactobacillus corticis]|uniref:Pyridoxamine 5'-phosphate oxidase N-terminal domain-containing protein n=1 Tax=Lactobacillus corticis TaxID=2201249 RepID=A0A916VJ98_9LACO|nr:pyridoxamine 5'-phosphate oxidase family protein [Lactobacillus corticis]GFZ27479.1 hypothetical protein LCB40_13590 [Lactobacillus corticis]
MRKAVPFLDEQTSNEDFLRLFADSFQSVVFATVDRQGNPITNVADIELAEQGRLYFATTYEKPFYHRLKEHPRISITALKGEETMDSVGVSLVGEVEEADLAVLDRIFASHPEMATISGENHSERRELLRPFAIKPISGSVYDLRQHPIFQKSFKFR